MRSNPFYHNYIFSKIDLKRSRIKWWEYPFLWMIPTYIQINDGLIFYFKIFQTRIFLMKIKKDLKETNDD